MAKGIVATKDWTRCLLTDTLPYETPLFFTNERLRSALQHDSTLTSLPNLAKHLLIHEKPTEPFSFNVHKGNGGRRPLAIPHPAGQITAAQFYSKFDGFIQNLCTRSAYSLRYPSRIASKYVQSQFVVSDDRDDLSADEDPVSFSRQLDWASSYFSYRPFRHMYLFFASTAFTELEKTYEFMMQLDVAKCFESIYTHSIAWAVRGKTFTKAHIYARSFEAEFDRVMRNMNWGETNGIIIGPEVSRIFAEIVLQAVDFNIEKKIKGMDIVVRRYVDDYLIFGHSEDDLQRVKDIVEAELRIHNLHLNEKKSNTSRRPLVTKLSIARVAANEIASNFFKHAREALSQEKSTHFARDAGLSSIDALRRAAKQFDVDYASLASPLLGTIVNSLSRLRKRIPKASRKDVPSRYAARIISETLRLALFVYGADVRVSTTQKFARILYETSLLAEKMHVNNRALEAQYVDAMRCILKASQRNKISGPEIVNLLLAVDSVCTKTYSVTPEDLARAIGTPTFQNTGMEKFDYFSLLSILYIARRKRTFSDARTAAIVEIERRILNCGRNLREKAAETMLFFDFLSCPYIPDARKTALVQGVAFNVFRSNLNATTASTYQAQLAKSLGFVDWSAKAGTKSLRRLLQRKELQPAYD